VVGGVSVGGMSEGQLAKWRSGNVGFIFQLYNLVPVLTAFENVELPLLLTKLSRARRRKQVELALSIVGLSDRMDHYPRQLSGGQEQRVAIARAIATDPKLLVADEPTGDLDARSGEEILILLERLNDEFKKTIVMVTHDPRAAARAHRLVHLDKGSSRRTSAPARARRKSGWRRRSRRRAEAWAPLEVPPPGDQERLPEEDADGADDRVDRPAAPRHQPDGDVPPGARSPGPRRHARMFRTVTRHKVSLGNPLRSPTSRRSASFPVSSPPRSSPGSAANTSTSRRRISSPASRRAGDVLQVFDDAKIVAGSKEEWLADRTGAVVGENLVRKFGWKLGDKVVLVGDIYPVTLELTVRGSSSSPTGTRPRSSSTGSTSRRPCRPSPGRSGPSG